MEPVSLVIVLVVAVLVFFTLQASSNRGKRDLNALRHLSEGIQDLQRHPSVEMIASHQGIVAYENLRVGEVSRHFDTTTSANIQGTMQHDLGFHGWGVGASVGRFGLGTGRVGLAGVSEVALKSAGVNRDDLMGDGFVAVLEKVNGGMVDTIRVVVPSEQATLEMLAPAFDELIEGFTSLRGNGNRTIDYPKSYWMLVRELQEILLNTKNEASYISDRLMGLLRMPPESRPLVKVYGAPFSDHAILGAAISFAGEDVLHPLFPAALTKSLVQVIQGGLSIAKDVSRPTLPEGNGATATGADGKATKIITCKNCGSPVTMDDKTCVVCGRVFSS